MKNGEGSINAKKARPSNQKDLEEIEMLSNQIKKIKNELEKGHNNLSLWGSLADLVKVKTQLINREPTIITEIAANNAEETRMIEINDSVNAYLDGFSSYQDGDFSEAEGSFLESIDIYSGNLAAYIDLGNLYFLQKKYKDCRDILERALLVADQPSKAKIHSNLGMVAISAGDVGTATYHLEEALKIDPKNIHALNNHGLLMEKLGDGDRAKEDYKNAILLQPKDGELWYNLGNLLGKQSDKEGRLFCFIQAEENGFPEIDEMIEGLLDQGFKPKNPFATKKPG